MEVSVEIGQVLSGVCVWKIHCSGRNGFLGSAVEIYREFDLDIGGIWQCVDVEGSKTRITMEPFALIVSSRQLEGGVGGTNFSKSTAVQPIQIRCIRLRSHIHWRGGKNITFSPRLGVKVDISSDQLCKRYYIPLWSSC